MQAQLTQKQKVRWLGRYQAAVRRQELLMQELTRLRADAQRVTAVLGGAPGAGGPNTQRLPLAVERIVEAQQELEGQIALCLTCRTQVAAAISAVEHPQQQEVLRRRYLLGQGYADIADEMRLVERRIFQLHRQGIEQIPVQIMGEAQNFPKEDIQNTVILH